MTTAVIPIRSFRLGKKRLASVLDDGQRHRIGRALAERVTGATLEANLTPVVVTADEEVQSWAAIQGITVIEDPGFGLNSAAAAGVATVADQRWLVLHSDLPLVRPDDLIRVSTAIDNGRDVIAPSSDGGTSVISASGTLEFAYGEASFHRHLARLHDPVVIAATGLLHDLDSPVDLASASQHLCGQWLKGIY